MGAFVGTHWELLIEVGDWSLQRSSTSSTDIVGICHSKCPSSWMRLFVKSDGKCSDCEMQIPQDVLGLWILYNFDNYTEI